MPGQSIITIPNVSFKYEDLPKLKEKYLAKPGDIVIKGDGHGNWRNVLLTLQIQGVANLTKQQHDRLNELYNIPGENLSSSDIFEILKLFQEIEFNSGVITKNIGDLVGDRGQCDIPMFILIYVLKQKGFQVDITISNHDQVFLDVWQKGLIQSIHDAKKSIIKEKKACEEKYLRLLWKIIELGDFEKLDKNEQVKYRYLNQNYHKYERGLICFNTPLTGPFPDVPLIIGAQDNSLQTLGVLLNKNIITEDDLNPLIDCYIDSLKLLDYQLSSDNKSIALLSHAPFPVTDYIELAIYLGMLDFDDSTAQKLAESIDKLNQHYRALLKAKDNRVYNIDEKSILYKVIWSRWKYMDRDEVYNFQPIHKGYNVYYIHGHDGPTCVPKDKESFIVSIDSFFAKSGINDKKSIILYHWDGGELNIDRVPHADALASANSESGVPANQNGLFSGSLSRGSGVEVDKANNSLYSKKIK